ncbi:hypothetical protein CBOM_05107 [Ceraceosorus bombacis]|uniref:Uncharacterized protein n=1 Tax=Ceraceosorus bombacis TaxID=401625 RepID=A0A0P1BJ20_9BASI|nr:hypothetical protein CBOM_05107 [Ceraceosorus bombacis]
MPFDEQQGNWTATCRRVVGARIFTASYEYSSHDEATYCVCGNYNTNVDYAPQVIDDLHSRFVGWFFARSTVAVRKPRGSQRPSRRPSDRSSLSSERQRDRQE